jgi:hypothetical protein
LPVSEKTLYIEYPLVEREACSVGGGDHYFYLLLLLLLDPAPPAQRFGSDALLKGDITGGPRGASNDLYAGAAKLLMRQAMASSARRSPPEGKSGAAYKARIINGLARRLDGACTPPWLTLTESSI